MSREQLKKQADQIMDRIVIGLVLFEKHGDRTKPLVFMSKDIMDILALSENILLCKDQSRVLEFFGCNVKMVVGENVLSVGYDLLEGEKIDKENNEPPKKKPDAIYLGFSQHDCEVRYRCPLCGRAFGSWSINMKDVRCPICKEELGGIK